MRLMQKIVSINDNNMHMHMNRNKYSHDLFLGISTISLITHEMEITITNHRGQEQEGGLTNYTKRDPKNKKLFLTPKNLIWW